MPDFSKWLVSFLFSRDCVSSVNWGTYFASLHALAMKFEVSPSCLRGLLLLGLGALALRLECH